MEFYNGLRRVGLDVPVTLFQSEVPVQFRVSGPRRVSGVYHHGPPESWRVKNRHGISWLYHVVPIPLKIPLERWGEWCITLLALLGVSSAGVSPPRQVVGFRLSKVSVS
jgi:hypothetical protein